MQDLLKLAFKAGVDKGLKDFGIKPKEPDQFQYIPPNSSSGYVPPNMAWGTLPQAGYGTPKQPTVNPQVQQ
jgi:hypothetical protein